METPEIIFATFIGTLILLFSIAILKPDKHGFEITGNNPYRCMEVNPFKADHTLAKCLDASECNRICAEARKDKK